MSEGLGWVGVGGGGWRWPCLAINIYVNHGLHSSDLHSFYSRAFPGLTSLFALLRQVSNQHGSAFEDTHFMVKCVA